MTATDDYAARECLADRRFTAVVARRQAHEARELVSACGLGGGELPETQAAQLTKALRISEQVSRESVPMSRGATEPPELWPRGAVPQRTVRGETRRSRWDGWRRERGAWCGGGGGGGGRLLGGGPRHGGTRWWAVDQCCWYW
jgi:hypothetical protein